MTAALCADKWALFDSTSPADHTEARALCLACPVRLACLQILHQEQSAARTLSAHGGGPVGTWAGQLIAGTKTRTTSGKPALPREHGTDRGYHQHRYNAETACNPCRIAHAATTSSRSTQPLSTGCPQGLAPMRVDEHFPPSAESRTIGRKDTTNTSRPRVIGAGTPRRGLADRKDTTDS